MERLVLHRIDPARNMARFYALHLQATLFGEIALVREWGRIGQGGTCRTDHYATMDDARQALNALVAVKKRRGYGTPSRQLEGL